MPRPATGTVVPPKGARKSWGIRYRVAGKRVNESDPRWTREDAESRLARRLDEVRDGTWKPRQPEPIVVATTVEPTFHQFAEGWIVGKEAELRPNTLADYRWALEHHLLAFFGGMTLSEISAERVDAYKALKLKEGKLGPNQINKTLVRLSSVLEQAVEYGHIEKNPAKGKRRRVKATKPRRPQVEIEQITALLEAADPYLRPVLSVLVGCGLRITEALNLRWADINFATQTLTVRESKTDAGENREVDLPIGVVEELATWKARATATGPTDPVFVTRPRRGRVARQTKRNVEARLKTTIRRANVKLGEQGIEPIDDAVSPHSLRRTYASLRSALRDDPVYIAEQGGWADIRIVFSIYQRAAKRREKLRGSYLSAFDAALVWSQLVTKSDSEHAASLESLLGKNQETASEREI